MAKKRVLVIEDDVECAQAYQAMLEPTYEVALAHDGTSGLEAIEGEGEFDLVLLDVMMPAGVRIETKDVGLSTGLELLRKIREMGSAVAVVVISVVWDPEITTQMRELGAHTVLQKPVRPPEKLVETVAEILGG
jgi:CheY-like chemotaxis protein